MKEFEDGIEDDDLPPETIIVSPVKKVNYLNNKDMLREIHKSKNTFCEYIDPKYSDYDIIIENVDYIFRSDIQEKAKIARASRFSVSAFEAALANYNLSPKDAKPKLSEFKISPDTIKIEDLVFRVLTFEHIPSAPGRKRNPKSVADHHQKLNFFPFKHYILENNVPKEVGKSHYKKGKFNVDGGSITSKLAKMFILMVNKYAQRGNWRGYCVDQQTEALTKRGWLTMNEITEQDTILSYNGETLSWSSIKSIYRDEFNGKMFKLTQQGLDCLITPNHKIVTEKGLIPIELLKESDKILLLANEISETEEIYEDSFVELLAWISTEGSYDYDKNGIIKSISIYQNPGEYAERIRNCLVTLDYTFTETQKRNNIQFRIFKEFSKKIFDILPNKNNFMEIIVSMSTRQRYIFLNTLIDGDGWRTGREKQHLRYVQKDKTHIDCVQALCAMLGRRSNSHYLSHLSYGKISNYYNLNIFSPRKNKTNGSCINMHGGKNNGRINGIQLGRGKIEHQNFPTEEYSGLVWCPETEYGCFVARRNGTVFLTGNTYLDEMKGQALLQLAQMGLQFDEYKSDNPFSYYTAIISNSFTRVLNSEKKNQDIRDDLLINSGANPSFSRQLALEDEIRRLREEAKHDD